MARNISRVIETGVESEVKRGRAALERVSSDVQRAVGSTLPTLKQHLRSAGMNPFFPKEEQDVFLLQVIFRTHNHTIKGLEKEKKTLDCFASAFASCHAIVG